MWKALSYMVFLALYVIVWRNVYKQSQKDVDEAFVGVQTASKPVDPIKRFLNAFSLRNKYDEEPPYSLFSLLVNIFMVLMWLLMYIGILCLVTWICDTFIIKNSIKNAMNAGPNTVYNVLTAFMGSEIAFISEACMTCMVLVLLMAIIIKIAFVDIMMQKETAKLMAKVVMIVILLAVPLLSLLCLVKEPLLKLLSIES